MKLVSLATVLAMLAGSALADEIRNPLQPGETWNELKFDVVGDAEILDGSELLTIDAPYRAEDAATVPITIREVEGNTTRFTKLALIVDENPAPIVAEFEFGDAMPEIDLEARMRINAYSNVRALATADDGKVYMIGRFVKASGGCSAPALKDASAALAGIGKMKFRLFDSAADAPVQSGTTREAQILMRHPNYSGLQMNQVTQLFIPAYFMDEMQVMQGDQLVFRMTGGISISENPSFRFRYVENGAGKLTVTAKDTEGDVFTQTFSTTPEA